MNLLTPEQAYARAALLMFNSKTSAAAAALTRMADGKGPGLVWDSSIQIWVHDSGAEWHNISGPNGRGPSQAFDADGREGANDTVTRLMEKLYCEGVERPRGWTLVVDLDL